MRPKFPRKVCLDLDDTLVPSSYLYHGPTWRCSLLISKALGHLSPYPNDLLKIHNEIDTGLVKTRGFDPTRFPESWVRTYETLAVRAGVAVKQTVCDKLLDEARKFADGPYETYEGAKDALYEISHDSDLNCELHLVTAGDDDLQRRKIRESSLSPYFASARVHVTGVDKKATLAEIAGDRPDLAFMVGDSKKSDIKPAIELGMTAIWVPSTTWAFANADIDPSTYHEIASVRELPALIRRLVAEGKKG